MSEKNKIVILGDSSVGKTALIQRWVSNDWNPNLSPTVGAAYIQRNYDYDGKVYKIEVWDTAGEEKYRSIAPIYSKNAFGAIIVFDLTSKESMYHVQDWISCLEMNGDIPIVVAANKSDLEDSRELSLEEAMLYIQEMNLVVFETSALTGVGVDETFGHLINEAIKRRNTLKEADNVAHTVNFQEVKTENSSCC